MAIQQHSSALELSTLLEDRHRHRDLVEDAGLGPHPEEDGVVALGLRVLDRDRRSEVAGEGQPAASQTAPRPHQREVERSTPWT
jgi:hypothetical protein